MPTITTISSSESYSFETVLFEKGPVDEGTLSYSLFDVEYEHTRDGETVFSTETGVEIRVHYVDELRIVNENTVFETTITVYDQNGDILDIRETTSNTNIRQMQVRFSESTKSSFHKWIPITNYAPNIVYR
ncbi:MAG: hypothetical protein KJZ77_11210 [Anaerolineales bacterium]|nr:hypothetical protein [Anaerolineales bacterium]